MIGYLKGTLLKAAPDLVLVDVQGVGYEVHIPLSTFYEIERFSRGTPAHEADSTDASLRLYIHTHLREDAITLFGFWTEREKLLFQKLIAVSGIGPRLARGVLSGMAPDDLVAALAAGDLARLATIPGVGRKTAERMVLELKDKMLELAGGPGPEPVETGGPSDRDVVSALINLGYKAAAAERSVAHARRERPDAPFHDLLRASLGLLSRSG